MSFIIFGLGAAATALRIFIGYGAAHFHRVRHPRVPAGTIYGG